MLHNTVQQLLELLGNYIDARDSSVKRNDFPIHNLCRVEDLDRFFRGFDTTRHHCPKGRPHTVRAIML